LNALPLTIVAWVKEPTLQSAADTVVTFGELAAGNFFKLGISAANVPVAQQDSGNTTRTATAPSALIANTWTHIGAVFTADNSRTAYINGAGASNSTASAPTAPTDITSMYIGASEALAADFNGLIGHVAIWDMPLTVSDMQALAGGANPTTIEPANLVAYWPLIDNLLPVAGSGTLLVQGGTVLTTPADNPPVDATDTAKLKLLLHPDAVGLTDIEGTVLSQDKLTVIGSFTGQAFSGTLEAGQAVLLVDVAEFDGHLLTPGDSVWVYVDNTTFESGLVLSPIVAG
jgi:hypothetical protein